MSVYENMINTFDDCNVENYLNLLHEDYVFVRHQSGQKVSKADWAPTVTGMFNAMSEGKLKLEENRCIYENDDILVDHSVLSFPDGSKEAVLACHKKKDGKIISSETGATPLSN